MPTMTITCPQCGISGDVDVSYANRKIKCRCGASFIAPACEPEPVVRLEEAPADVPQQVSLSATEPVSTNDATADVEPVDLDLFNESAAVTTPEPVVAAPEPAGIDMDSADEIDRCILQLRTEDAEQALAKLPGYGMRAMERLFAWNEGSRAYAWPDELDADAGNANMSRAFAAVGAEVLDELLAMLPDADTAQTRNIIYTLGRVDDPRVTDPLLAALKHEDAKVRLYAVSGVNERRIKRAVSTLITLLADPDERVQYLAVGALGELGDRETLNQLQQRMQETDNPHEMRNIQEVMGWLSM